MTKLNKIVFSNLLQIEEFLQECNLMVLKNNSIKLNQVFRKNYCYLKKNDTTSVMKYKISECQREIGLATKIATVTQKYGLRVILFFYFL